MQSGPLNLPRTLPGFLLMLNTLFLVLKFWAAAATVLMRVQDQNDGDFSPGSAVKSNKVDPAELYNLTP